MTTHIYYIGGSNDLVKKAIDPDTLKELRELRVLVRRSNSYYDLRPELNAAHIKLEYAIYRLMRLSEYVYVAEYVRMEAQ